MNRPVNLLRDGRDAISPHCYCPVIIQQKDLAFETFYPRYTEADNTLLWHGNAKSRLIEGRESLVEKLLAILFVGLKSNTVNVVTRILHLLGIQATCREDVVGSAFRSWIGPECDKLNATAGRMWISSPLSSTTEDNGAVGQLLYN